MRANDRFVACRQGQSCSSLAVHGGRGRGSSILHHPWTHMLLCGTTLQLSEGHTESQATLCYPEGLCSLGQILPLFKWVYKSVP